MQTEIPREMIDKLCEALVDKGKLIEAGWVSLEAMSIPNSAGKTQRTEMRNAFFAGAQHLFHSIMSILEPGSEPTEKDLQRMEAIDTELREFIRSYKEKHML